MSSYRRRALMGFPLVVLACAGISTALLSGEDEAPAAPTKSKLVDPGTAGGPPSDAIVLFNGKDLSAWSSQKGEDARWLIEDGALVATKTGNIRTREKFGDVQLHIEWNIPKGGNSGVKFHEWYEIQMLDAYGKSPNKGLTGSVYKQHAPLVNASRKANEWQTYDIIFRAPRFDAAGKMVRHGRFTVFHNGVLIQDNVKILGITNSAKKPTTEYERPFLLTYHGCAVRFRNIWLRRLDPRADNK